MRTDILDLIAFYESGLGRTARDFIGARIAEAWADHARLRIAGFGFVNPYLGDLAAADRTIALAPAGQGVARWPSRVADDADDAVPDEFRPDGANPGGADPDSAEPTTPPRPVVGNRAALVAEHHWPLPDASIDRLLIVHGLEETAKPQRLMREAWRVLADDGRLIIVAAHRRGVWSLTDATPFSAGRPYFKGQVERLLQESMFRPEHWAAALHFPPVNARFMLRAARAWERAGARLWPFLSGVVMVEATKDMASPIARVAPARVVRAGPALARPGIAAGRSGRRSEDGAAALRRR